MKMNSIEQTSKETYVEENLIEILNKKLNVPVNFQKEKRLWISINYSKIIETCLKAYELSFEHLSTIAVTDWIDEDKFEITYHLWSYKYNVLLTIKTKIDRKKPVIPSINSIWDTYAEACERECHELFGVNFEGNSNLTPLFLEDWQGPPPFLKDFNWREYVKEEFYDQKNSREETYFEVGK